MLWGDVWQGVVGQKVWILPESTRQSSFSAPATPFLASRNAATYGDSIILGVPVGPRGNPWDGPLLRGPFGFMGVINGWRSLTRNPVCFLGTPSVPRLAFVPQCVPPDVLRLMYGSGPFDLGGARSVCGPIGSRYPHAAFQTGRR